MKLLYRGSVKDIYQEDTHLLFKYSNRYSVFDWGEMPDEIPQKGEALAALAGLFFEYFSEQGVSSHYLKQTNKDSISVNEVAVLRPYWDGHQYDYSMYQDQPTQCLVPLEVIFRFLLGKGNSLEGRLRKNPDYLAELGLLEAPDATTVFNSPLIECSTKLETTDRYLTKNEIRHMNVISDLELGNLHRMTQEIAQKLRALFASFGVQLWDGKFEFAFGKKELDGSRSLFLVDSIGPDELRLTYEGAPLSKEFLRQIYAPSSWYQAVGKSKEMAKERGTNNWKEICLLELKQVPPVLLPEQIQVASLLYKALANEVAVALKRPRPFEENANLKVWRQQCASLL